MWHCKCFSCKTLWDKKLWCPGTALACKVPMINGLARLCCESGSGGSVQASSSLALSICQAVPLLIWQSGSLVWGPCTRNQGSAALEHRKEACTDHFALHVCALVPYVAACDAKPQWEGAQQVEGKMLCGDRISWWWQEVEGRGHRATEPLLQYISRHPSRALMH